jgi:hypothetical protein
VDAEHRLGLRLTDEDAPARKVLHREWIAVLRQDLPVRETLRRLGSEEGLDALVPGQSRRREIRVHEPAPCVLDRDAVGRPDRDECEDLLRAGDEEFRGDVGIDRRERLGIRTPDQFLGPFDVVQRRLPVARTDRIWLPASNRYPAAAIRP